MTSPTPVSRSRPTRPTQRSGSFAPSRITRSIVAALAMVLLALAVPASAQPQTGGTALSFSRRQLVFPLSPSGGNPVSLGQADFDGDGVLDLAIARALAGRGSVEIHLGVAVPNGSADPPLLADAPRVADLPFTPRWLAAGDFDADGRADLIAIPAEGGEIGLLAGTGNGSFAPLRRFAMPQPGPVLRLGRSDPLDTEGLDGLDIEIEADGPSERSRFRCVGSGGREMRIGPAGGSAKPENEIDPRSLVRFWDGDAVPDRLEARNDPPRLEVTAARPQAVYLVTTAADAGPGSLRQAMLDAEASPGLDTITFAIGAGPQTIAVLSPLPILTDAVTLDATSQPGYAGTPLVELDGALAGVLAIGLDVAAPNSTVRGLAVNRFDHAGIDVSGAGGCRIEGNFVGADLSGTLDRGNLANGVAITDSPNNVIGGTAPGAANLISGNDASGLEIFGAASTGNRVEGNRFGTTANGLSALRNDAPGVRIREAIGNTLGGTAAGAGNLISGNGFGVDGAGGVELRDADGNFILGNRIGTDATGQVALPNVGGGIRLRDSSGNWVGSVAAGAGNVISGNLADGVEIRGTSIGNRVVANRIGPAASGSSLLGNGLSGVLVTGGTGNAISENAIGGNGGIGIDLGTAGITPNDLGDGDTGANTLQNFPVLSAANCGTSTVIQGTLSSTPSQTFGLEFFASAACDALGNGEGERFLGAAFVTTNGLGVGNFSVTLPATVTPGSVVTATATLAGNTSEFSACRAVVGSTPGEVGLLSWVSGSKDRLVWTPVAGAAGYELHRGNATTLPMLATPAVDSCLRWAGPGTDTGAILDELPGADSLLWFLVTAGNSCGRGPASGAAILDSAGPCGAPVADGSPRSP